MPQIVIGADVDKTLSFPNHDITDENVELCRGLEQLGIPVVLSTGKALEYAWRNADLFGGQAVFVENHAVWSANPTQHEVCGPNHESLVRLREIIGLSPADEGVCTINLEGQEGQVAIEEGKFGVLTLFIEYEPVKHRWTFQQQWERWEVYGVLRDIIREQDLKLFVLEPHGDSAIDAVRLDEDNTPIDKRSFSKLCRQIFPDVEKMAFLGDGTNDLPAMTQPDVVGITFSNASRKVIIAMQEKNDIVTERPAPEGGPAEGILTLVNCGFFKELSLEVARIRPVFSLIPAVSGNLPQMR